MGQVRLCCVYCQREVSKIEFNPDGRADEIAAELIAMTEQASIKCKCGLAKEDAKKYAKKLADMGETV